MLYHAQSFYSAHTCVASGQCFGFGINPNFAVDASTPNVQVSAIENVKRAATFPFSHLGREEFHQIMTSTCHQHTARLQTHNLMPSCPFILLYHSFKSPDFTMGHLLQSHVPSAFVHGAVAAKCCMVAPHFIAILLFHPSHR